MPKLPRYGTLAIALSVVQAVIFMSSCVPAEAGRAASTSAPADSQPSDSSPQPASPQGEAHLVELTLGVNGLTPRTVTVKAGDRVRLEITSQRSGFVHVEEYGEAVTRLSRDEVAVIELTAEKNSPIIFHPSTGEVEEIGMFVVE